MFRIVVVHRYLSCAWSVLGSVILNQWCVCVRYDGLGTSARTRMVDAGPVAGP